MFYNDGNPNYHNKKKKLFNILHFTKPNIKDIYFINAYSGTPEL